MRGARGKLKLNERREFETENKSTAEVKNLLCKLQRKF